jgi:hypothetical protein
MSMKKLKEKLEQGFYVDNLYEMARLCKDLALESEKPAPFYILQKIFFGIADYWEERPVEVEEARIVEGELLKSIKDLVDAIDSDVPAERIMSLMNKAVSSYYFLYR